MISNKKLLREKNKKKLTWINQNGHTEQNFVNPHVALDSLTWPRKYKWDVWSLGVFLLWIRLLVRLKCDSSAAVAVLERTVSKRAMDWLRMSADWETIPHALPPLPLSPFKVALPLSIPHHNIIAFPDRHRGCWTDPGSKINGNCLYLLPV